MRTVFLDRDGVINANRADHVKSWREFEFLPGSLRAMRLLTEAGFQLFVVTNQAAINRNLMSHDQLAEIHRRMLAVARQAGAHITDLRYCPHRPEEHCGCRKPEAGMLRSLIAEHGIGDERGFIIGDTLSDIAAGHAVGCRGILVKTGRGAEQLLRPEMQQWRPEHIARDLLAAAGWILAACDGQARAHHTYVAGQGFARPEPPL